MNTFITVKTIMNSVNSLYNTMENDINYISNILNDLIQDDKLYGYQFSRLGGEQNISLFLFPNSKFTYMNLGSPSKMNTVNTLHLQFDKFKELDIEVKLVANEIHKYMNVVTDSKILKDRFIQLAPDSSFVTKSSLNKSIKKNNMK